MGSITEKGILTLQLKDLESDTAHELKVIDMAGMGADGGWYNWIEVHFDGATIFQT